MLCNRFKVPDSIFPKIHFHSTLFYPFIPLSFLLFLFFSFISLSLIPFLRQLLPVLSKCKARIAVDKTVSNKTKKDGSAYIEDGMLL